MILRSKKIVEMIGKNSNEEINIKVASQSIESVVGKIERI